MAKPKCFGRREPRVLRPWTRSISELWIILPTLCLLAIPSLARARVVLVGIDGGSWNLFDPLIRDGELPNIKRLLETGASALLKAQKPVNSPSVWTTIATGRRPAQHGVTDFHATRLSIRVPTVFERLAQSGHRVGLYDYLVTWPPEQLPGGFVIPGWLRHDSTTSPEDVWTRAGLAPYVMSYDEEVLVDQIRLRSLEEMNLKGASFNALSNAFQLDLGVVTFYALDNTAHRFWRAAFPEEFLGEKSPEPAYTSDQRGAIHEVLRGLDGALGEIAAGLGPDDTLVVVSDHGFQRSPSGVDDIWIPRIDALLAEADLDPTRDSFHVVTDFGTLIVYVHSGPLDERDEILDRLLSLIDSIRNSDDEQLFATDFADLAQRPKGKRRSWMRRLRQWGMRTVAKHVFHINTDREGHAYIFARPREEKIRKLWPKGEVSASGITRPVQEVFGRDEFTGDHHPLGVLVMSGPAIARPDDDKPSPSSRPSLSALDVAPLLFYLSGAAIPDDLEGRLPEELLRDEYLTLNPPRSISASELPQLTPWQDRRIPAENPELVEMLRRLGYVR